MHRFHRRVALGLALSLLALATRRAAGQYEPVIPESELILPTLTVTAPRGPSDPVPAASSVTVVERATLESSEERNLNEVLRGLPGVTLHRAGSGTTLSSVSVRGVQSGLGQFTLDGIPLYSGVSGAFNLSAWPAADHDLSVLLGGYLVIAPRCLQGIAVEFRHRSWLNEKHADEVLAFEREHNLAHVVVDEPQGFVSSIPAVWEVTCQNVAVMRLHGRNRQVGDKRA